MQPLAPYQGPTYCLACHRAMMNPEPVCPRCGADQETVRAELVARLEAPPPRRGFRRHREPPLPLNAVEPVACPTCRVPVPAGAPSCSYCGHTMLTDLPKWTPDDALARRYLFIGLGSAFVGLVAVGSGIGALFIIGCLLVMAGMMLGITGFGYNPLGWGETVLLALVLVIGMLTVMLLFATMFIGFS